MQRDKKEVQEGCCKIPLHQASVLFLTVISPSLVLEGELSFTSRQVANELACPQYPILLNASFSEAPAEDPGYLASKGPATMSVICR